MKVSIVHRCFLVLLLGVLFSLSIFAQAKKPEWGSKLSQPVCETDILRLTDAQIGTLGIYWYVTEPDGWSGVWTRRGSQQVYDATWKHTNGTVVNDVIRVMSWDYGTKKVAFFRDGNCGRYYGVIDLNRGLLQNGTTSWYPAGATWSARISNTRLQ